MNLLILNKNIPLTVGEISDIMNLNFTTEDDDCPTVACDNRDAEAIEEFAIENYPEIYFEKVLDNYDILEYNIVKNISGEQIQELIKEFSLPLFSNII